jgi:hypothetical protein
MGYGYGYSSGYGYGYGYGYYSYPEYEYKYLISLVFNTTGTYEFTQVEAISGNQNQVFELLTPVTINVVSPATITTITTNVTNVTTTVQVNVSVTVNVTTNVTQILHEVGIEHVVNKTVGLNNVVNVSVVTVKTTTPSVQPTSTLVNEVENSISTIVGQPVAVSLQPVTLPTEVNVITLTTTNGTKLTYTVIKQTATEDALEHIPKSVAQNVNEIQLVKGTIVQVINPEPVVILAPENDTIEYMVPGDVAEYTSNITAYKYTYTVQNVTTVTTSNITQNVTTNITTVTTTTVSQISNETIYIIVGVIVVAVVIYFLIEKGIIKINK